MTCIDRFRSRWSPAGHTRVWTCYCSRQQWIYYRNVSSWRDYRDCDTSTGSIFEKKKKKPNSLDSCTAARTISDRKWRKSAVYESLRLLWYWFSSTISIACDPRDFERFASAPLQRQASTLQAGLKICACCVWCGTHHIMLYHYYYYLLLCLLVKLKWPGVLLMVYTMRVYLPLTEIIYNNLYT